MEEDKQYSVSWNNFETNLSTGFHESLCCGDLIDVTLAAEGKFVRAHQLILSVSSPYFREMFRQMPANQHAFVFLKDVSQRVLNDLITFIYCGEVKVEEDKLPEFMSTARALQIKGLTETDHSESQFQTTLTKPTTSRLTNLAVDDNVNNELTTTSKTAKRVQYITQPQSSPVAKRKKVLTNPHENVESTQIMIKQENDDELLLTDTLNPTCELKYEKTWASKREFLDQDTFSCSSSQQQFDFGYSRTEEEQLGTETEDGHTVRFRRTSRGSTQLFVDEEKYTFKRKGTYFREWQCVRQRRFGCAARAKTDFENTKLLELRGVHNHGINEEQIYENPVQT